MTAHNKLIELRQREKELETFITNPQWQAFVAEQKKLIAMSEYVLANRPMLTADLQRQAIYDQGRIAGMRDVLATPERALAGIRLDIQNELLQEEIDRENQQPSS